MTGIEAMLATAVLAAVPLLYAALGELLAERVGVLNIGIDGIMLIGAVVGFIVGMETGNLATAMLAGGAAGSAFTVIAFAVPTVVLGSSQVLVGFALWFIGIGLSAEIGTSYAGLTFEGLSVARLEVPMLSDLPWLGHILFGQIWPVYVAVVLCLGAGALLNRTKHGLNMRAIGNDPATAHAMGIAVKRWQVFYSGVSGFLGGVGGAVLSVAVLRHWQEHLTVGRGFIALALVIFAAWKPVSLLWTAYLFGILLVLADFGQAQGWGVPSPLLGMAPYLVTIAILMLRGWRATKTSLSTSAPPASLGQPFFRGQRR